MCRVMGVENPCDPDPTYELTTDNANKIMAIYMRFRYVAKYLLKLKDTLLPMPIQATKCLENNYHHIRLRENNYCIMHSCKFR